ncbi:UTP--glucose-1-phosphate uridylyltransferase [Candidatus Dependentiae bacterium]|nr:UTP--glucose-1-phosphate uridylyltransferase [Candidatus Dependentiae bacterium]
MKVIIPAAGLGQRLLPLTKSLPKEMLPLLDKPAAQYIVEEGIRSGIEDFIVVVNKHKKLLEDHFDASSEDYLATIEASGNSAALEVINKIVKRAHFAYLRQPEPRGLGHAVALAARFISEHYFGVMLPDDIIISPQPCIGTLAKIAQQEKGNVIAIQEVPDDLVSRYGIVSFKKQLTPNLFQVKDLIEKPSKSDAPSNFAIVGRYVLSSSLFEHYKSHQNTEGEIQLTDIIKSMVQAGERLFAYRVQGTVLDAGTPLGYLKSVINLALKSHTYGKDIREYIELLTQETPLTKEFVIPEDKIKRNITKNV